MVKPMILRLARWLKVALGVGLVGACSTTNREPPPPALGVPTRSAAEAAAAAGPVVQAPLPPAQPPRNWKEMRRHFAERVVEANPKGIYLTEAPEVLLAIPVLEIELKRDGSIDRIVVLRKPRQAQDTTQLAIDAVRRAAPFGDISHLPRPWKFTETFLFQDDRRFKPRTLDE